MTRASRTIVARQEVAGLAFTSVAFEPGTILEPHAHPRAYVSYVGAGSYTERVGGVTRRCDASTILVHPAGERHANVFHGQAVQLLRVEATDSGLLELPCGAASDRGHHGEPWGALCRRMLYELHAPDDVTPLVLHGLALELVAGLARSCRPTAPRTPGWLSNVDALLQERFSERIGLVDVAAVVGVHPVHLARTYRQHRGRTLGERLRELRIEHACRLLATTGASIAEIALASGFADQSHLARHMKRRLGASPSRYRRRFANAVPSR